MGCIVQVYREEVSAVKIQTSKKKSKEFLLGMSHIEVQVPLLPINMVRNFSHEYFSKFKICIELHKYHQSAKALTMVCWLP